MNKQHADSIFVKRLLDNEQEAWEEFARRFHNCIYGAVFEQFRNRSLDKEAIAEDFLVDIYVNRKRKLGAFRGDSTLETYIWSICRNFCRNIARSRRRMRQYLLGENPDLEESRLHGLDPPIDEILEDEEICEILRKAVEKLPPNERMVIELYFFDEMKEQEIADTLGKSPGWVSSYKKRGLEMLRKLLKNFEEF